MMHGSPLSSYDNRDMCKNLDFKELDLKGEGYLSINLKIFTILPIQEEHGVKFANVRDKAFDQIPEYEIKSTVDLKKLYSKK